MSSTLGIGQWLLLSTSASNNRTEPISRLLGKDNNYTSQSDYKKPLSVDFQSLHKHFGVRD